MAQHNITLIENGSRNVVAHISFVGTGAGDLSDEVLIDPATTFAPPLPAKPNMTILGLWYDLTGFSAQLEFDYLTSDTPVWSMSADQPMHMDFRIFGGMKDRSAELGGTGKLKITTKGLDNGDVGTLIIHVKKG